MVALQRLRSTAIQRHRRLVRRKAGTNARPTPEIVMDTRKQSWMVAAAALILLSCSRQTGGALGKPAGTAMEPATPAPLASGPPTASAGGQHKIALLIGINKYANSDKVSPLAGSLNDVEEMRQLLIGKFEFPPENILVLTDAQATHAGIINAIQTHL